MNAKIFTVFDRGCQMIFTWLSQEIWYAALIFVLIWSVTRIFKKSSLSWQSGLWSLVLLRLILPPDFGHALSVRQLAEKWLGQDRRVQNFFQPRSLLPAPQVPVLAGLNPGKRLPAALIITAQPKPTLPPKPVSPVHLLVLSWISGVVIFGGLYVKRLRRFQQWKKQTRPVALASVQRMLACWQKEFRIRRPLRLITAELTLSPFTTGFWRPVIFIPGSILHTGNLELLESVIAHELAHIKRGDEIWTRLQNLIQIVYFFNPLVWITNSKINLLRESICDQMVLMTGRISPLMYGQTIIQILKLNLPGSERLGTAIGFGNSYQKLTQRILLLKGGFPMRKSRVFINLALIVLGLMLLPMAQGTMPAAGEKTLSDLRGQIDAAHTPPTQVTTVNQSHRQFILPVATGVVTFEFSRKIDSLTTSTGRRLNRFRIIAPAGTQVHAVAAGKVQAVIRKSTEMERPAKQIVLQHPDNFCAIYMPLDSVWVKPGQMVLAGQTIGVIGYTEGVSMPYLQFEIEQNQQPVEITDFFNFSVLRPPVFPEKTPQFISPMQQGRLSSDFGKRLNPVTHQVEFHQGVDLAAPIGTPVYAVAAGVVRFAEAQPALGAGYGKNIILEHEHGFSSRYANLDTLLVVKGQLIQAGAIIGKVGNSGFSTGPHLHFELKKNEEFVNPEKYIKFRP
ncbi:M23/M56 family metallopeptidase [candidate division KSB1 bacterium]|nr:M23/M56 family metallopeptidase [candidate division KSB1 bacterium]